MREYGAATAGDRERHFDEFDVFDVCCVLSVRALSHSGCGVPIGPEIETPVGFADSYGWSRTRPNRHEDSGETSAGIRN